MLPQGLSHRRRMIPVLAIILFFINQTSLKAGTDFVWQTVDDTFVCDPGEGNPYTNAADHSYGGSGSRCVCSATWTYEYNGYLPMGFFAALLKYNTTTEKYPNPTLTGNVITGMTLKLGTLAGMVGGGGIFPRYANPGYFDVYWLKNDVEWIQGYGRPHDNEVTDDGGITYNMLMSALQTYPDAMVKVDTCYWLGEQIWNTEEWYSYTLDVGDDPEFINSVLAGETFTLYLAPSDTSNVAFNFHAHVQGDSSRTDGPILTITTESCFPGDATLDGVVNVSDLSLLAANYGTGSSTSLDYAADYARIFDTSGEDSSEGDETSEETSSSVCGALGLPLLVELAIMSLMLVKFEY